MKAPSVRSAKPVDVHRWGLAWRSRNQKHGAVCHLMHDYATTLTFITKREAIAYAALHYGYIARRFDLRGEPHVWFLPKAVRVRVRVEVVR